jgi:hypothetical protein
MLTHIKSHKTDEKPTDPLTKKWLEIEKKKKRNATAKSKIEALYQRFQDEILPEEQESVVLLGQETRHLMSFLPRKSLTQWQREELHNWIDSNLDNLSMHPFGDAELINSLREEYSDALVKGTKNIDADENFDDELIAQMRALCEEMFEGEVDFTDEQLSDFIRDPAIFQETFQKHLDQKRANESEYDDEVGFYGGSSENDSEGFDDHYQQAHDQQQQAKNKQDSKLKSLFNSSNLNKLYKMLANKLHPDKEKNEHLKAEKSALMAQLVKAKKNKDAYTIISMFHQFLPESELNFFDGNDEELTQALIKLLNEKMRELDQENHEQKYHNGIQSMVWQKFSGRSKKVTQENIDMHLADVEDSHIRSKYYIHEVKTVKLLQEILSERYEQSRFNPFGDGNFSLDDLDAMFR